MVDDTIDIELFKPQSCGDQYHYYVSDQQFGYYGSFLNVSVSK